MRKVTISGSGLDLNCECYPHFKAANNYLIIALCAGKRPSKYVFLNKCPDLFILFLFWLNRDKLQYSIAQYLILSMKQGNPDNHKLHYILI